MNDHNQCKVSQGSIQPTPVENPVSVQQTPAGPVLRLPPISVQQIRAGPLMNLGQNECIIDTSCAPLATVNTLARAIREPTLVAADNQIGAEVSCKRALTTFSALQDVREPCPVERTVKVANVKSKSSPGNCLDALRMGAECLPPRIPSAQPRTATKSDFLGSIPELSDDDE